MEASGERNARAACKPLVAYAMSMLRGPLRYGPSGNERTGCSNSWCSGGIALGESITSAGRGT